MGVLALLLAAQPAQAQLLRGLLDTTSSNGVLGNGVLGTGVTIGTTAPGSGVLGTGLTLGTTGTGVLGTGVTVGTTGPGDGLLGTGVTVGTTTNSGGVLGTGVTVGTTNPGSGILGTGLVLGTTGTDGRGVPGTPGGGTGVTVTLNPRNDAPIDGGATGSNLDLAARLARLEQRLSVAVPDFPLRGTDTIQAGVPVASGANAVAAGYGASATGNGATALGGRASAAGDGSVAVGHEASAAQANAIAIGSGVRTTRAGQVAIGNAQSTYTMAGLGSATSLAAQSGETRFVTSDASGNLATSAYGPGSIAALDGRVGTLEASVGRLQRDMRGAYQGTAIALALAGAVLPAGKNFAISTSFGTYHGETGFGASGVARVSENLFVSGGVGVGTSGQSNVAGRGGLTYAW
ncbi:YadA-like family protein [Methylobacterium planeticum]|nr:YadA-like family protein [Methylobacterium planeticum]